jgi:hypothetical protein
MSDYSEWTEQRREYGWFGRMIAPAGGGRPATLAFTLGLLGVVAFAASLFLKWHTVTLDFSTDGNTAAPQLQSNVAHLGIEGPPGVSSGVSLVYMLGVVACLGVWGAVVTRPELALRTRMAVGGVGAGLLAVVVAMILRRPDVLNSQVLGGTFPQEMLSNVQTAYEPGIFAGLAAVVLPVVAVWLAGKPAQQEAAAVAREESPDPEPKQWSRSDNGLTVSSEPMDLTVSGGDEAWARPHNP